MDDDEDNSRCILSELLRSYKCECVLVYVFVGVSADGFLVSVCVLTHP